MATLVFNAGSSSLKFALFDAAMTPMGAGKIEGLNSGHGATLFVQAASGEPQRKTLGPMDYAAAVRSALQSLTETQCLRAPHEISAVGQRIVHGGVKFFETTAITPDVEAEIESLTEIAPLHNPPALHCIRAARAAFPNVPQFAVFDTAYFHTLSPAEYIYPLPYAWYSDWGIRRFGFHGISHGHCARRAVERLKISEAKVVSCHLGQGASVTASLGTQAISTSMGFTPLEGLMMGTRSGSIDPGILLFVERQHGLTPEQLEDLLNHESGVKAVSGLSADFREIATAALGGHARAMLAVEMFIRRVKRAVGEMAANLGGIDALVFTGGIGENAPTIRERIAHRLEFMGLSLDVVKNKNPGTGGEISAPGSSARIFVFPAEEERSIAEAVQQRMAR